MKTDQIYIVPKGNRYFLIRSDKKRVGSKWGYLTKRKAEAARWFLINGKDALLAQARMKQEMSNELRHWHFL